MVTAASVNLISEVVIWKQEEEHTEGIADILRSYTKKVYHAESTETIGSRWTENTARVISDVAVGCVNRGNDSEDRHGKMGERLQNICRISQIMRMVDSEMRVAGKKNE